MARNDQRLPDIRVGDVIVGGSSVVGNTRLRVPASTVRTQRGTSVREGREMRRRGDIQIPTGGVLGDILRTGGTNIRNLTNQPSIPTTTANPSNNL